MNHRIDIVRVRCRAAARRSTAGLLLVTLAACAPPDDAEQAAAPEQAAPAAAAAEEVTAFPGLESGWNSIAGGGDTVCSDGSDYRFFVRPGDPQKLVVYFQGGGACWLGANCDPHLDPTYKQTVAEDDPARYDGIFNFGHPENPFADHTFVMAPYCSGDVHLGDAVATYEAPAREAGVVDGEQREAHDAHELTIHHKGLVNAQAVLDWTYEHVTEPAEIFVTGSSAGSIPSPYFAWLIADHYGDARVAQLGDGSGGYRRSSDTATNPATRWGTMDHLSRYPEFADMPAEEFAYEDLYIAAARRHPEITFAEYDAAEDSVQKRYLAMSGSDASSLMELLEANHADIRAEVDNFRAYIAGGDSHTILARPEFYSFQVDGRRVRDWVADLAAFEEVEDVACDACEQAELVEGAEQRPEGS